MSKLKSSGCLDKYENWLWQITRFFLQPYARFESDNAFILAANPFPDERIYPGPYRAGMNIEDANTYRLGHPLAQNIIESCKRMDLPEQELQFQYSGTGRNIAVLDSLIGKSGWLRLTQLSVSALEMEDHLVFSAVADDGQELDETQCQRLFSLPAEGGLPLSSTESAAIRAKTEESFQRTRQALLVRLSEKNSAYFEEELDKLDRWGEDQRNSLKATLKELEERIREKRKEARLAPNLPDKLNLEREKRRLETKRDEAWRDYEDAARKIEQHKDSLMDDAGSGRRQFSGNTL